MRSTRGAEYTVLRPTLEDFVLEMPRGAQVIYPKDLAPICMLADIGPGMRVFESGVGSGALSMTMLRAGADDRRLRAARGLRQPGPEQRAQLPRGGRPRAVRRRAARQLRGHRRRGGGVRPGRARPARAVAGRAARRGGAAAGGILVAYTPSIMQAAQAREALRGQVDRRPDAGGPAPDAGTSTARRCGPTTGWSPTPGFLTVRPLPRPLTRPAFVRWRAAERPRAHQTLEDQGSM